MGVHALIQGGRWPLCGQGRLTVALPVPGGWGVAMDITLQDPHTQGYLGIPSYSEGSTLGSGGSWGRTDAEWYPVALSVLVKRVGRYGSSDKKKGVVDLGRVYAGIGKRQRDKDMNKP